MPSTSILCLCSPALHRPSGYAARLNGTTHRMATALFGTHTIVLMFSGYNTTSGPSRTPSAQESPVQVRGWCEASTLCICNARIDPRHPSMFWGISYIAPSYHLHLPMRSGPTKPTLVEVESMHRTLRNDWWLCVYAPIVRRPGSAVVLPGCVPLPVVQTRRNSLCFHLLRAATKTIFVAGVFVVACGISFNLNCWLVVKILLVG